MNLLILLFAIVILLLLVIITILVTGWPGRQRDEMERIGNGLRREMAEHRAESIRMMNAIRITVEDSIQEAVEREMAAARPRRSRKASKAAQAEAQEGADAAPMAGMAADETPDSVLIARQISLFQEPDPVKAELAESIQSQPAAPATPVVSSVMVIGGDDLPDVE